jgi:hypothetical protein
MLCFGAGLSCAEKTDVSELLYLKLYAAAQEQMEQLQRDYTSFEDAAARKNELEVKIDSLEQNRIDLSGWWEFGTDYLINCQDNDINEESVAAMYVSCKEINECNNELSWCHTCENHMRNLKTDMETLEELMENWQTGYHEWEVTDVAEGVSTIAGNALGYGPGITSGQWYFNVTDNTSKPINDKAKGLQDLLENRQTTYADLKQAAPEEIYNCVPPQSTDRRAVDYWIVQQLRGNYKEGSLEVAILFKEFPHVQKVWKQLAEIGYDLTFKGGGYIEADKTTGEKSLMFFIFVSP